MGTPLEKLDLSGNKLTDQSAKQLLVAVQKYPKLKEIKLDNNAISPIWLKAIERHLKKKQQSSLSSISKSDFQNKQPVKIPEDFCCSISQQMMLNPYSAPDGETYEKEEIEAWLSGSQNRSPIGAGTFTKGQLNPNNRIKSQIQEFLEKNPELREGDELYFSKELKQQCLKALKEEEKDKTSQTPLPFFSTSKTQPPLVYYNAEEIETLL